MSREPFETVVAEHGAAILRVCRAIADPEEAEDVWSETFLAALRAYDRLREDSNLEGWLVTIAHRKAIDHRRAAARRPVTADPLPEPRRGPLRGAGRARGLWRALESLPLKQRLTIAYHHLAGLSYREVARIVGGGEPAARRAAADGIAALRRELGVLVSPAVAPSQHARRSPRAAASVRAAGRKPVRKGMLP